MALKLTAPPADEPLTLADAKHHLRIDTAADDTFITSLITTSRLHIEAALGLALITQGWRLTLDRWPGAVTELPLRPLQAVQSITLHDVAGGEMVVDANAYLVDAATAHPRIIAIGGAMPQPGRTHLGIAIDFTAGFGDNREDVPHAIRQALAMLVAHWYEHREAVTTGEHGARIPIGVSDLLAPWRPVRL
jgi:uncharacterized phiE125 gp8 family phage protein